jgi:RNA 2',3'-cyclic 3'-phosphodiesterase
VGTRRLFVAAHISDEARSAIADRILGLRDVARDVKVAWERPEKLHFTLKFLGNTDEALIPSIEAALRHAAVAKRFDAVLGTAGVFPSDKRPRILWVGLTSGGDKMAQIAQDVNLRCAELGFEAEKRAFKPHVTIARIREPDRSSALSAAHLQTSVREIAFSIDAIHLYESKLRPSGSVYVCKASFHLAE